MPQLRLRENANGSDIGTASAGVRACRCAGPGQPLPIATLAMYLNSGGDERIKPDPLTGRTRYGTTSAPAEDEIWFSSSTASSPDPRSFAAAGEVLRA